jgi:hypothetical protein
MKRAPALSCGICGRRLGKAAGHYLLEGGHLACTWCIESGQRGGHHAALYPDCPHRWHDLLDHLATTGTRAGIAATLGLWP